MPGTLSTVATVAKGIRKVLEKYPVTRGMVTYSLLWPAGNLLQQTLDDSRVSIDLLEALRYGIYGSCITAPLLYNWLKVLSWIIPGSRLKHAILKGYVDQVVFAPLNISQFFLGMSLLEGKSAEESIQEWQDKMLPTWMISLSIWPIIQTINFNLVPAKNRVMAVSLGSFLWMVFLSYMHHTTSEDLPASLTTRPVHYDYKHGPREALESFITAQQMNSSSATPWSSMFPVTAHCYVKEKPTEDDRTPAVKEQLSQQCTEMSVNPV